MYLAISQYNETLDITVEKFKTKKRALEHLKELGYGDFEKEQGNITRGSVDYGTCFVIPLRQIKVSE